MIFFILILILIISNGMVITSKNEFQDDYMSKERTTAINGVFVIMVLFGHYSQYIPDMTGVFDMPYMELKNHLNQMVVATFFFYSGYGTMQQIFKQGRKYAAKMFIRFTQLLIRFDTAVTLFLILALMLKKKYSFCHILLSYIAWENLGNSNWYIFVILCVYLLVFIAYHITKKAGDTHYGIVISSVVFVLTIGLIYFVIKTGRDMYWYNTVILFPLGMFFSLWKNRIDTFVMRNAFTYAFSLTVVTGIYILSYLHRWDYGIKGFTVWAVSFISIVILVTMKIRIVNPILDWVGKHIFSIYILQRIPMILLSEFGCIENHRYWSLVVVILTTALIAIVFDYLMDKLLLRLFKA